MTDFWNPNVSENVMNAAWDSIDTNPIAVALDDKYVEVAGLPPTTRFPWDTERSVYYLKGIHDLHCLVGSTVHISKSVANTKPRNLFEKPSCPSTREKIKLLVFTTFTTAWTVFDKTLCVWLMIHRCRRQVIITLVTVRFDSAVTGAR